VLLEVPRSRRPVFPCDQRLLRLRTPQGLSTCDLDDRLDRFLTGPVALQLDREGDIEQQVVGVVRRGCAAMASLIAVIV